MTTFQQRLIEIQNEQKALLASPDRRKKLVRAKINQLTADFYAVKEEWQAYNKENKIGIYAFV